MCALAACCSDHTNSARFGSIGDPDGHPFNHDFRSQPAVVGGAVYIPTADYFGSKNLGYNYGLVFLGWGIAFFVPQLAGHIKDVTGRDTPQVADT